MVFFIIILIFIVFNRIEFAAEGTFLKNQYLDKSNTTSVNGIFVILVIFSHYSQYANFEGVYDDPYIAIQQHLNQMVVATFLFYSGYGMMESIQKKGKDYLNKIPVKFIELLIRFDLAVCLFLFIGFALNLRKDYSLKNILLSFTGWSSIGNSNWYIFVILCIYLLLFISFSLIRIRDNKNMYVICTGIFTLFTAGFVLFMIIADKDMYWYNTAILVPVGFCYSLWKDKIERVVMFNDFVYLACVVFAFGVYFISFKYRFDFGIEGYTIWAISFIVIVLLVTMKVKINNSILEWFGKHIFSIYILQRIPMIILDYFGYIDNHRYICLIIVIVITAFMAIVFEYITDRIFTIPNRLVVIKQLYVSNKTKQ